ncbi:MAG TPA: hypothetical protein VMW56_22030 [Candidatus Margulisiibacteriota bacterium]|nr:hypothetical protein [Candidatus Margulisiibacteriota bacterium]
MKRFLRRTASPLVTLAVCSVLSGPALAGPPAQKLPSALLVFPLIAADESGGDTRVELLNLSGQRQDVECFYVFGDTTCNEIGFFLSLTPYQPLSWLATEGLNDVLTRSAAPPFIGQGELKCAVVPPADEQDVQFHNTLQGRATVYSSTGRTVSYGAVGFQRLSPGDFTGVVSLDGTTYAQCPDKLHFDVVADQPTATPATTSDLILVPCSQDLLLQVPATITVQFLVINEFEQPFSTSISVTCFERAPLNQITDALLRANLGTDTAHLIIRGVNGPLLGLVLDEVAFQGKTGIAGNEPSFQGGRSATVVFP